MKRLRVGTGNAGKLREFRQVLSPLGFDVVGIDDLTDFDVVEDGRTFAANATIKARAVMEAAREPAVADDSGLVVDALNGAPGVHSARYAADRTDDRDAANNTKLLEALRDVADARRTARFVCVLAYCVPGEEVVLFCGTVEGRIGHELRGSNGFGYDPLFVLPERGLTTAELKPEQKNAISHRGRALRALADHLASLG